MNNTCYSKWDASGAFTVAQDELTTCLSCSSNSQTIPARWMSFVIIMKGVLFVRVDIQH